MSDGEDIKYALDFRARRRSLPKNAARFHRPSTDFNDSPISRIARLMALAIRFDAQLRAQEFKDLAQIARLGQVTRARMTQVMKLLNLAPDIQEQILFLPPLQGLNERNLRPIASRIDWQEQRGMFQKIVSVPSESSRSYSQGRSHRMPE